jgi:uncharacterized membrane protein
MKIIVNFIKTTLAGGLLIVLPLLLFYVLFGEILDAVVMLATPIADLFPDEQFDQLSNPEFVAGLLILSASFLFGMAVRVRFFASTGRWLEANTLGLLPIYRAIKQLAQGLIGGAESSGFKGGLLDNGDGTQELVYIIEEAPNDRLVVLVPFAPASFTGSCKIVEKSKLRELEVSAGEVSKVIAHWGVGTTEALDTQSEQKTL